MKAESSTKPKNKFEIENIIDGKCEIVFFDNIKELEPLEDTEKRYCYDIYRLKANYRDDLEQDLKGNKEKYKQWLEVAKETEYNELASAIRKQRNNILNETDKYLIDDYPISEEQKEKYKNYRKALRDITEQLGFPYEVSWPTLE